jgi:hypothetical protein
MSYDSSLLATSELQQVRALLGGEKVDSLISDAEINYFLSVDTNVYYAAASCADMMAGRNTERAFSHSVGPAQYDGKTKRDSWFDLAKNLRARGKLSPALDKTMLVGVSTAEREVQSTQEEYPPFYFSTGMHDNKEGK